MRLLPYVLMAPLFLCCGPRKSPPIETIPRERFVELYVDLLIAGESGRLSNDTTSKRFIDSLYAHYGVGDTQVRITLEEYSKDLHRWKDFYDEVTRRLEAKQKEEQSKKNI